MDFDLLKPYLTDTIPWIKDSDLHVDVFKERHVKLSVPVQNKHMNHVGYVYAGTHFMLMELAGAALYLATYGFQKYVPITKGINIKYSKPANTDLSCELSISQENADKMIAPVLDRGKGDWILEMDTKDANNEIVSSAICNYYLIPFQ